MSESTVFDLCFDAVRDPVACSVDGINDARRFGRFGRLVLAGLLIPDAGCPVLRFLRSRCFFPAVFDPVTFCAGLFDCERPRIFFPALRIPKADDAGLDFTCCCRFDFPVLRVPLADGTGFFFDGGLRRRPFFAALLVPVAFGADDIDAAANSVAVTSTGAGADVCVDCDVIPRVIGIPTVRVPGAFDAGSDTAANSGAESAGSVAANVCVSVSVPTLRDPKAFGVGGVNVAVSVALNETGRFPLIISSTVFLI